jgi:RHS repeat-associated protein
MTATVHQAPMRPIHPGDLWPPRAGRVQQVYTDATSNLTTYYFFGGAYEVQDNGTSTTTRVYYAFAGMTVAVRTISDSNSTLDFFLTDHLGSIVAVTDASGALMSEQRYLPFGQVRTDVGSISQTDFGYTGQRNLDAQGTYFDIALMDYKARFYDPYITHEFIQPDSIIPDQFNPQALNRYSYVYNNPINKSDPDGHCGLEFAQTGFWGGIAQCLVDTYNTYTSYANGQRNILKLGAEFLGITRMAQDAGRAVDQMNSDVQTVFSNKPLKSRILPSLHVGIFAVGVAATLVGLGQAGIEMAATARMQALTNAANTELGANPALAKNILSDAEYAVGQANVGVARMQYGNAVERIVGEKINNSWIDRLLFRPVGGPSNPDFVGKGILKGMNFDITTPGQVAAHLARPYGPGLNILTYIRSSTFSLFP